MASTHVIVTMKRRHFSKVEVMHENALSQEAGEVMAMALYHEHSAHQVAVIEVNPKAIFKEDRWNVVFKCERSCLHPGGFQHCWNEKFKQHNLMCETCKLTVGEPINVEDTNAQQEEVTASETQETEEQHAEPEQQILQTS